jgi:hypothetical protein
VSDDDDDFTKLGELAVELGHTVTRFDDGSICIVFPEGPDYFVNSTVALACLIDFGSDA